MKLKINSARLADLVSRGASSAPKNSPAAIANNARIVAKSGVLSIASTDFEMMVEASGECEMDRAGAITIDADKLRRTVERLPKNVDVSLTIDDSKRDLIMKAGRSRVTFPTLPVEDWPARKTEIDGAKFKVAGADLAKLFSHTAQAVFPSGGTALAGVFFHAREIGGKRMLAAVGTTGTLLIMATTNAPAGAYDMPAKGKYPGVILSKDVVDAALKLFRDAASVSIEVDERAILFSTDTTLLTSSLLTGVYPDYSPLVSTIADERVVIDRQTCINTVMLLEPFATKDFGHRLQCAGSSDGFVVAVGTAGGQGVDVIDADIEGEIEPFGINGQFMKTVLNAFKSETIALHPDQINRRVAFHASGETELVGVVAMMNIQTELAAEPKHE